MAEIDYDKAARDMWRFSCAVAEVDLEVDRQGHAKLPDRGMLAKAVGLREGEYDYARLDGALNDLGAEKLTVIYGLFITRGEGYDGSRE